MRSSSALTGARPASADECGTHLVASAQFAAVSSITVQQARFLNRRAERLQGQNSPMRDTPSQSHGFRKRTARIKADALPLSSLDASAEDQRRMRETVGLFSSTDSRDELGIGIGIGQTRDALSDTLFPGTSVLSARARCRQGGQQRAASQLIDTGVSACLRRPEADDAL